MEPTMMVAIVGALCVLAIPARADTEENPFTLEIERRELMQQAEEVGGSRWISCKGRFISIPMVIDGLHLGTYTMLKSNVIGVYYISDEFIESLPNPNQETPYRITITLEVGVGDDDLKELLASQENYIPLLDCLHESEGLRLPF